MNTIEDFKNAPVGATATSPNGNIAFKNGRRTLEWFIFNSGGRIYDTLCSDEMEGYTLNPAAPTTAREALDLAWQLAHEVKEGQEVPTGTECISKVADGEFVTYRSLKPFDGGRRPGWAEARTLDPLPDPEPDWLDAPAVIAVCNHVMDRAVFVRENETGTQWVRDTRFYRWSDLRDVTPLYPKEQEQEREVRKQPVTVYQGDHNVGVGHLVWHPGGKAVLNMDTGPADALHDPLRYRASSRKNYGG